MASKNTSADTPKTPSVKILVGYHKPSFLLSGEYFVPIWAGKEVANTPSKDSASLSDLEKQWLNEHCIGDDTGKNISNKNRQYSEASILYWMWQNYKEIGNPDWIGFMQYRRHFVLNKEFADAHPANQHNLIVESIFHKLHQEKIGLSEENILKELKNCDGIFSANDTGESIRHYKEFHHSQNVKWWNLALDIIKKDWPAYASAAEEYNNGTLHVWSNCFIMRREDFLEYCPFLFSILQKIDEAASPEYPDMTPEQMRVPAYVSETMLGIFWLYLKKKKKRLKSFPLIYIKRPFELTSLLPKYIQPIQRAAIPIVFIADKNYFSYTTVTIQSIIKCATPSNYYDMIILEDGTINHNDKQRLANILPTNFSVRFFNAKYYMEYYNFESFWHTRLNLMPYLKGFIPNILRHYDKALFVDGDLLFLEDAAGLYSTELNGNLLAATRDCIVAYVQSPFWKRKREYCKTYGNMHNPLNYFNSGVLLLNLKAIRNESDFLNKFILHSQFKHIDRCNHDQDSLNFTLEKRVKILPGKYNFQCNILQPENYDFLSYDLRNNIEQQKKDICILHFDGDKSKPWKLIHHSPYSDLWWQYARQTPFYEELLMRTTNFHVRQSIKKIEGKMAYMQRKSIFWDYYRCKILSKITWGNKRKHYKQKRDKLHEQVRKIRTFLK